MLIILNYILKIKDTSLQPSIHCISSISDRTHICILLLGLNSSYANFITVCACAGPKVTSGLCLYIGLLVAPATNTVKVINSVGESYF